jgi:lipopolysaccharide transport system ATP-binding protein
MSDAIITAENLSKCYMIGHLNRQGDGLRHVLDRAFRSPLQWLKGGQNGQDDKDEEFWALKDLEFEIQRGDVVGIIGRNGAGKSTLLKILSRITEPTTGRITMNGRVASLLEVGTGFHAELTGRENIFLNGAILGMTQAEIKRKFDEIVAFSEVERFLDTPVKRYSSGMYTRLAFAVAAHLEPEILIVDEVLAVGDAGFQKKCLGKMQEVSLSQGRTVLFVSHNMGAVTNLCRSAFWLQGGKIKAAGEARSIVQDYLTDTTGNSGQFHVVNDVTRLGPYGDKMRIQSIEWLTMYPIQHGAAVRVAMHCHATADCDGVAAAIGFSNLEGVRLLTYDTDLLDMTRHQIKKDQNVTFEFEISDLPAAPGIYNLDLGIRSGDMHMLDFLSAGAQIEVVPGERTPGNIIRPGAGIRLPCRSRLLAQ